MPVYVPGLPTTSVVPVSTSVSAASPNVPDGAPVCASVCSTLPVEVGFEPEVTSSTQLVSGLATGASLVPKMVIVSVVCDVSPSPSLIV